MKKLNKKQKISKKVITFSVLGLFAIALVAAATFYFQFSDTFNVQKSITGTGESSDTLSDVFDGDIVLGSERVIKNNALDEREVIVTEESDSDVDVSYKSDLTLSKKEVVFGSEPWVVIDGTVEDGTKVDVEYTLVGDEFSAEVVDGSKPGYVLIYYKDKSDRWDEPANAIKVENVNKNLPYSTDANADEYNYCDTDEYLTCHGAKIWYVPSSAINSDKSLDWSRASEFYFETELIQYNQDGNLVVYPNQELAITPVYEVQKYAEGDKTITTTIA